MPSCVVKWCKNNSLQHLKANGITFHIFPQNRIHREQWIKAVRLERRESDWMPSKTSKICSVHFKDEYFHLSKKGLMMLSKSAVPICTMVLSSEKPVAYTTSATEIKEESTLADPLALSTSDVSCPSCGHHFRLPDHLAVDVSDNIWHHQQLSSSLPTDDSESVKRELCNTPLSILSSGIESPFNSPETYEIKKELRKKTMLSQKRLSKINCLRRRNRRLIKKCVYLKCMVTELRKNKYIEMGLQTTLSNVAGDNFSNLKNKIREKKTG